MKTIWALIFKAPLGMLAINKEKLIYLAVGGWNTIFGYFVMVGMFTLLSAHLHVSAIALFSNVASITMSFVTYKWIVFKSKNKWWSEYLKCYMVYGGLAIFGIIMTWIFVDFFKMNIWASQGITVPVTVAMSYFGHKKFTFSK